MDIKIRLKLPNVCVRIYSDSCILSVYPLVSLTSLSYLFVSLLLIYLPAWQMYRPCWISVRLIFPSVLPHAARPIQPDSAVAERPVQPQQQTETELSRLLLAPVLLTCLRRLLRTVFCQLYSNFCPRAITIDPRLSCWKRLNSSV
jgi:hypothetical protein